MATRINPDGLIASLEKVCRVYGVTIEAAHNYNLAVVIRDASGKVVCDFCRLHGDTGPIALEIGDEYKSSYSTGDSNA